MVAKSQALGWVLGMNEASKGRREGGGALSFFLAPVERKRFWSCVATVVLAFRRRRVSVKEKLLRRWRAGQEGARRFIGFFPVVS